MRTIKFRAKIQGCEGYVIGMPHNVYSGPSRTYRFYDSIQYQNEDGTFGIEYIQSDTLSQFTGLLDKNGKEIYENDTVKIISMNRVEKVFFHKCAFCIKVSEELVSPIYQSDDLEIIVL